MVRIMGKIFIGFVFVFFFLICVKQVLLKFDIDVTDLFIPLFENNETADIRSPLSISEINAFEKKILNKLKSYSVEDHEIKTKLYLEERLKEIKVTFPLGRPFEEVILDFTKLIKENNFTIERCEFVKRRNAYILIFIHNEPEKGGFYLSLIRGKRYIKNSAEIAFVIENFKFGTDTGTTEFQYLSFPEPLTFILSPYETRSTWTADAAHDYKKEVIVKLHMEGEKPKREKKFMLKVHQSEEEIQKIIKSSMEKVPHSAGFACDFSTIILKDTRMMTFLLENIKSRNSFFMVPRNPSTSSIEELASRVGVPLYIMNTTFNSSPVDSLLNEEIISMAMEAQKKGQLIVGVKSDSKIPFINVLKRNLKTLQNYGIKLVHASSIVQK